MITDALYEIPVEPEPSTTFPVRFTLSREAISKAIHSATGLDVPPETVMVDPTDQMPEGHNVSIEIPVSWVDGNEVDRTNRLRFLIGKEDGHLFFQIEGLKSNFPRG